MAVFGVSAESSPQNTASSTGQHRLSARRAHVGRSAAAALGGTPRQRRRECRPGPAALARAKAPLRRLASIAKGTGKSNVPPVDFIYFLRKNK